jgi:hypothetical protein
VSRHSDDELVLGLWGQANAILDGLDLGARFGMAELRSAASAVRGHPVYIVPSYHSLPAAGPHGMWVPRPTADYIVYDASTPLVRQVQIIGHEVGHLLFDDPGVPIDSDDVRQHVTQQQAPTPTTVVRMRTLRVCRRTVAADLIEDRAELFGSAVLRRFDFSAAPVGLPFPPPGSTTDPLA